MRAHSICPECVPKLPTTQLGPIKLTPRRILEIIEEGRKRLSSEDFEELTNLLLDVRVFGMTPWANVRITELILRMEAEPEVAPEWSQALVAGDRKFLGDELRAMAREAGISPLGGKKELCARLYGKGVVAVRAVMEPYLKSAIPVEQYAMMLPQIMPWESKTAKVKSTIERIHRDDPEEFYRRRKAIKQAIEERKRRKTKTMTDFTLEELQDLLEFTGRLYR